MRATVQVVPDCPHTDAARTLLQEALIEADLGTDAVAVQVVTDEKEAQRLGFTGSPTFLLDGRDLLAVHDAPCGVSCRLYPTAGGLQPLPEPAVLLAALRASDASRPQPAGR